MSVYAQYNDAERTILYFRLVGRWTRVELDNAIKEVEQVKDVLYHNVIIDLRESAGIPADTLSHLRTLQIPMGTIEWSVAVIITADSFVVRFVQTFAAIFPHFGKRFTFAQTDLEAFAIIAAARQDHFRLMTERTDQ